MDPSEIFDLGIIGMGKDFSTWIKSWTSRLDDSPFPWNEAINLFDKFTTRPDLAFDVIEGGCEARAQLMCMELINRGRKAYKAWGFSEALPDAQHVSKNEEKTLNVTLPNGQQVIHKNGEGWFFHVALALPVKFPFGQMEHLVFDPTLFDGPVTLQEWGGIIGALSYNLQICPFGSVPIGFFGDYIPTRGGTKALLKAPSTNPVKELERIREAYPLRPRSVFKVRHREFS